MTTLISALKKVARIINGYDERLDDEDIDVLKGRLEELDCRLEHIEEPDEDWRLRGVGPAQSLGFRAAEHLMSEQFENWLTERGTLNPLTFHGFDRS